MVMPLPSSPRFTQPGGSGLWRLLFPNLWEAPAHHPRLQNHCPPSYSSFLPRLGAVVGKNSGPALCISRPAVRAQGRAGWKGYRLRGDTQEACPPHPPQSHKLSANPAFFQRTSLPSSFSSETNFSHVAETEAEQRGGARGHSCGVSCSIFLTLHLIVHFFRLSSPVRLISTVWSRYPTTRLLSSGAGARGQGVLVLCDSLSAKQRGFWRGKVTCPG